MTLSGYNNPMRGMERRMAPDFAQREFRDPGIRSVRSEEGLGSLHKTMPHLRRFGAMHFQGGGATDNPVGRMAQAQRGNTYNPDAYYRQILAALQPQFTNRALNQLPQLSFPYQQGGVASDNVAPPDIQDVEAPDEDLSSNSQQEREVVLEALAALEGQHPDPKQALARFIEVFGPRALKDLQLLLEEQHRSADDEGDEGEEPEAPAGEPGEQEPEGAEPQGDEEDESPEMEATDELGSAGGGLLNGPGTGQSDEIEGSTPSGRPVLLSDGEYVIDAPTVAALGDGSTNAGARRLDALRKQIRKDAYGTDRQAKPMAKGGRALVIRLP